MTCGSALRRSQDSCPCDNGIITESRAMDVAMVGMRREAAA